jgi:transposase
LRGSDERTGSLFSYVDLEARVRKDHPLRPIRLIVNETLSTMERDFAALYAGIGRPSVAPEMLLRAMLLQVFYSVRSERQLMERLEFDLLFRWFVGIGIDEPVWDHSTFSKNRDRLLEGAIAASFLSSLLAQPKVKRLLSSEHFLNRTLPALRYRGARKRPIVPCSRTTFLLSSHENSGFLNEAGGGVCSRRYPPGPAYPGNSPSVGKAGSYGCTRVRDKTKARKRGQEGRPPKRQLKCSPAFAPFRFAKIAFAWIGPLAPVVIEDFAKLVEHLRSDPQAPAGESFTGGSCRAFLFPSSAHRGDFQ